MDGRCQIGERRTCADGGQRERSGADRGGRRSRKISSASGLRNACSSPPMRCGRRPPSARPAAAARRRPRTGPESGETQAQAEPRRTTSRASSTSWRTKLGSANGARRKEDGESRKPSDQLATRAGRKREQAWRTRAARWQAGWKPAERPERDGRTAESAGERSQRRQSPRDEIGANRRRAAGRWWRQRHRTLPGRSCASSTSVSCRKRSDLLDQTAARAIPSLLREAARRLHASKGDGHRPCRRRAPRRSSRTSRSGKICGVRRRRRSRTSSRRISKKLQAKAGTRSSRGRHRRHRAAGYKKQVDSYFKAIAGRRNL